MTQRPTLRPVDAASLMLADLSGDEPRFLMGRRSGGHIFMAHARVFPGGRLERADNGRTPPANVAPGDLDLLTDEFPRRAGSSRAAGLIACAMREAREETGIDLPPPALCTPVRYIARAITPPGQVRRYDTRFFMAVVDRSALAPGDSGDGELAAIDWYPAPMKSDPDVHPITAAVMGIALARLRDDPGLTADPAVPYFRIRNGRRVIEYPADGAFP